MIDGTSHTQDLSSGTARPESGPASSVVPDGIGDDRVGVRDGADDTVEMDEIAPEASPATPESVGGSEAPGIVELIAEADMIDAEGDAASDEPPIRTGTIRFQSHDGHSMVNWRFWAPYGRPRAIIQLVHGMSEHIDRYDHLARHFAAQGYLVAGHDHIGHGETAPTAGDFGHMPLDGGDDVLVNDTHALATYIDTRLPGLPHILYGHSMGSFIVRVYLAEWGDEVDAAVLSGTATFPPMLTRLGLAVTEGLALLHGERAHSNLVNDIAMGAYNAAIDNPRTDFDWIAADDAVVDAYVADERSGFQFTLGGYGSLLKLIISMVDPRNAAKVPKDLPMLFIAGEEDPVGDMGAGVEAAVRLYEEAGVERVDLRLYPDMRHEVHNEQGGEQVLADVSTWLDEVVPLATGTHYAVTPVRKSEPDPGYPEWDEVVDAAKEKVAAVATKVGRLIRHRHDDQPDSAGAPGDAVEEGPLPAPALESPADSPGGDAAPQEIDDATEELRRVVDSPLVDGIEGGPEP